MAFLHHSVVSALPPKADISRIESLLSATVGKMMSAVAARPDDALLCACLDSSR
jgi:hypothetical protein